MATWPGLVRPVERFVISKRDGSPNSKVPRPSKPAAIACGLTLARSSAVCASRERHDAVAVLAASPPHGTVKPARISPPDRGVRRSSVLYCFGLAKFTSSGVVGCC